MTIRQVIILLAGLCLATFVIGCGNNGPIAPPTNVGNITIVEDGDDKLVSNEPVLLTWDSPFVADYWITSWSDDGGKNWQQLEIKFFNTTIDWVLPKVASEQFVIKAEGWDNHRPVAQVVATTGLQTIFSFGEPDSVIITNPELSVTNGTVITIEWELRDQFKNIVPPEENVVAIMTDFGDGVISTDLNPQHVYNSSGEYWVTITVITDSCVLNDATPFTVL